jgi:hypothetical protein
MVRAEFGLVADQLTTNSDEFAISMEIPYFYDEDGVIKQSSVSVKVYLDSNYPDGSVRLSYKASPADIRARKSCRIGRSSSVKQLLLSLVRRSVRHFIRFCCIA